jgi:hypothetical protein
MWSQAPADQAQEPLNPGHPHPTADVGIVSVAVDANQSTAIAAQGATTSPPAGPQPASAEPSPLVANPATLVGVKLKPVGVFELDTRSPAPAAFSSCFRVSDRCGVIVWWFAVPNSFCFW